MGLFDELKRLTQPYGDEDDYYEGADGAFQSQQTTQVSDAQRQFENAFGEEPSAPPEPAAAPKSSKASPAGSIFGNLGNTSQATPKAPRFSRASKRSSGGSDQSVIRFNPKDFDEAGELVSYLEQGRSLIMSLEELPGEAARRLLDFMSGIAFALGGKITPVSAKTYFVTPENVDLLDARPAGTGGEEDQEFR